MMNRELALHEFMQICKSCDFFLHRCDDCKIKVAIHDIRAAGQYGHSGHCSACSHVGKRISRDESYCDLHMKEFDVMNGSCEYWDDKKFWAKKRKTTND